MVVVAAEVVVVVVVAATTQQELCRSQPASPHCAARQEVIRQVVTQRTFDGWVGPKPPNRALC
eukprot:COSAG01_NODE_6813_length_3486_cov_3.286980_4_plen_62_part_01